MPYNSARKLGAPLSLGKLFANDNMISDVLHLAEYRELLLSLTLREIRVRYKQTLLGIAWTIVQPLSLMVVFTLIFSYFIRVPSDGIPYPIFAYCALVPWVFFATSISRASASLINNSNLVTKCYFPREVFPLTTVMATAVDFLVASSLLIGLMIFYRVPVTINLVYLVPVVAVQILLTLGLALFLSAANVFFRDIGHAVPLLVQIWLYLSPVVYPLSLIPEKYRSVYLLNPMAGIIHSYRATTILGQPPEPLHLALATLVTIPLFVAGYTFFKRSEKVFADII